MEDQSVNTQNPSKTLSLKAFFKSFALFILQILLALFILLSSFFGGNSGLVNGAIMIAFVLFVFGFKVTYENKGARLIPGTFSVLSVILWVTLIVYIADIF